MIDVTEDPANTEPPRTEADEDKIRAFNLLDVVARDGWTLSTLYFSWQDEEFRAQLRRYIRINGPSRKQRFETITASAATRAGAVIRAATMAVEDGASGG
jgi:hypothetical protein